MQSIKEVSDKLENDLQRYIEATYHLHHPRLLKERRALMNEGESATEPWVEATPTYVTGDKLRDLGLPAEIVDLLKDLEADELGIYDPPYKHQADALQSFFTDKKDLIVSTGTGSGKTEIFLYSILGQLAQEASRGKTTEHRGMRTLVLYPMNALVADQLSRMRLLFGDENGAATIEDYFGRIVQFGMYTSRTPYHGEFDEKKNDRRVKPIIDRYLDLQREEQELYNKLDEKGRIPAKNLSGFRNFGGSKKDHFQTQPRDRELFTRQEMHTPNEYGGTPDILITNYSMLEYMLLRPIEQPLFEDTKQWLDADAQNELTIVLDEAHLYRGAQGAEVALLLSRLLQKLEISRERVRFILTSATMGENIETAAPEFAAELTTGDQDEFAVISGEQEKYEGGEPSEKRTAEILKRIGYTLEDPSKIRNLAGERDWDQLQAENSDEIRKYLGSQLKEDPLFRAAHTLLRDEPLELTALANELFTKVNDDLAREATGNFLFLCTEARRDNEQALLPTRLHMFLKGLPAQYACVNPECSGRQITEGDNLLGKFYSSPHTTCPECGSRVFELISHRTCGAAYLRAYRRKGNNREPIFLWTDPENSTDLEELHLLVEQPRTDPDPKHDQNRSLAETTPPRKLAINSGYLLDDRHVGDGENTHIDVWVPTEEPPEDDLAWSWSRCPACGIEESRRNGKTKIEDLVTKGEEPFANIVRSMFGIQPKNLDKEQFPNKGRKVLCFSDGRQKAARLARDLQNHVELDSFREVLTDILGSHEGDLPMDQLFAEFSVYCRKENIVFFDDSDEWANQDGVQYEGSRSHFENIQDRLDDIVEEFYLESIEDIPETVPARNAISERPKQFDEVLLRSIGDEYYSIPALLIGYIRPTKAILDALDDKVPSVERDLLENILIESLRYACEQRAFDPEIDRRRRSKSYRYPKWFDPDEVGVPHSDLIPEYVVEAVGEAISEEGWGELRRALMQTDPLLFESDQSGYGNYLVNPGATTIELRLDENWYRCEGCRRFAIVSLNGSCPQDNCNGSLVAVSEDDTHLQARKGFYRNPPRDVLHGRREPLTLRSEEHSAQLSAKDNSEAFARSEEYELLFQDILVGDSEADQPIDVLSCTTTMEVGIDIGSLTGVAMRTVPPAPENYEQRAGRAGRRGTGLSTIITFADNSPHESYYFNNPDKMITSDGTDPIIYVGNEKIAQRHINASLLARYFDPSLVDREAAVFDSLSSTEQFFEEEGAQTLTDFEEWLDEQVFSQSGTVATSLGDLLPDALGSDRQGGWRTTFVRETANDFLSELQELQSSANWEEKSGTDEDLLTVLLDAALLPTFSFPTDVCDFLVKGNEIGSHKPKTKYEMSRDLKQALSTYVPGREIVVDKKTYESYGLYFKFADDQANRASGEDWGNLDWLNWCPVCQTVFDNQVENLQAQDVTCPVCDDSEITSLQMYTPSAFAPEVDQSGSPEEGSRYSEERVYATQPKYPLTTTTQDTNEANTPLKSKTVGHSTVSKLSDEQLLVANFGPDEDGFEVCTKCGAVSGEGELTNPHNRPYPKDFRFIKEYDWPNQCSGSSVTTSFSHTFPSDLTVFQIPLREELDFIPAAEWFQTAAQSLAEALIMGASRALGIENDELEGGFRTRSADLAPTEDVRGVIEVFLFDTTAGGAGFSAKVWDEFDKVLAETRSILTSCECDMACHNCLRRYDNRHLHDSLNRHQGYDLLTYAETGDPPTLNSTRTTGLIQQLERALDLQSNDITVQSISTDPGTWKVSHEGSTHTFSVRSSLRRSRVADSGMLDADYSEYQLTNRLPEVAHAIIDQLE